MKNVRVTQANGTVLDNLIDNSQTAFEMFTTFQYEVDHPDEAEKARGDHRITKVMFVSV